MLRSEYYREIIRSAKPNRSETMDQIHGASAIPLEEICDPNSSFLKAVVKCADELAAGISMSEREFRFSQALYELVSEFRERVEEDCRQQNRSVVETKKRMEPVSYASFSAIQPLIKAYKIQRKPETKSVQSQTDQSVSNSRKERESANSDAPPKPPKCYLCAERHFIYRCSSFKQKTPRARLEFVQNHHLCHNCMNHRHTTTDCEKPPRCIFCDGKHHAELHTGLNQEAA